MKHTQKVEIKILDERIREWGLPKYQSDMAAAVDLFACIRDQLTLAPQAVELIPSGIALHIADPHIAGVIVPRSGLGHRNGLVLGNLVGILDADFTGQLMISVWNRSEQGSEPMIINPGDRIAQMLFLPIVRPLFEVVDEFSRPSLRGGGGFGSTGGAAMGSKVRSDG